MTLERFAPVLSVALALMSSACSTTDESPPSDAGTDVTEAAVVDAPHAPPPDSAVGCDDETGQDPASCQPLIADAQVCTYPHLQCVAYRTQLKKRRAALAIDCILAESEKEACGDGPVNCGIQGLKDACDDPTADTICDFIVSTCGAIDGGAPDDAGIPDASAADASAMDASDASASDANASDANASDASASAPDAGDGRRRSGTTFAECKTYLNGMRQTGRDKMEACMASTCGFYPCAEAGTCGGGMKGCLVSFGGAFPQ
jgi:hypothetical protein